MDDEKLDSVIKHSSFDTMKKDPMANYEGIPKKSPGGSFLRKGTLHDFYNSELMIPHIALFFVGTCLNA